ncbi:MAG: 3-methyl-2-oxobutanoate hydroxymethyltransferase [Verrucomicrobia bacterium]|nr:3-methyl-2-oxobutanoate hydroxymethyltransferase [Verrucomicrobiota bacterium]MCH8527402.1 3-methyl-2-oxobutanoate hydroxymethyltransferase [Kiritimatiellia bacterium]
MKMTPAAFRALKGKEPIPTLTASDTPTARLVDAAGIPLILVGDSLGMTVLGFDSTLSVTLDHMLHHTAAVARGVKNALVVADMPFMTYQVNDDEAVRNAGRFLQEAGADAVKLEGGAERAGLVKRLVQNGIPVMAHIGLTPQSVKELGYKVQGRGDAAAEKMKNDAKALAEAGAFAIVLEACPAPLAQAITESVPVPTIGIGAGAGCDGQILVLNDMLGIFTEFTPKFVKVYARLGEQMRQAFEQYAQDVRTRAFPAPEHTYKD